MHFTGVVGTGAWAGVYVTQVCFYTNVHICDTLAAGCAHMCTCTVEQIELQAKLLNYFLGSNKSNINQYMCVYACICIWMRMCVYNIA